MFNIVLLCIIVIKEMYYCLRDRHIDPEPNSKTRNKPTLFIPPVFLTKV